MSEHRSLSLVNSRTDNLKSLEPLASFEFKAHTYHVTEQASNNVHIHIKRAMRKISLPGMIMQAPPNTLMGLEASVQVKYRGQPAQYFPYTLSINNIVIQSSMTDHGGAIHGLDIALSNKCKCLPYWFNDYGKENKFEYNLRCCDGSIPFYKLNIFLPPPRNSQETASESESGVEAT